MLVLDTNVLSELMLPELNPRVDAWIDAQDVSLLWTTAVNVFELEFGLRRLPPGRRRERLASRVESLVHRWLRDRVLTLNRGSAIIAAEIHAQRVGRGVNIQERDAFVAAIAMTNGATLVTRNVVHFADLDLPVINPWALEPSSG
jgi:predicted nucleic acid-binding protein